jgi:predicted ATP-dependent endonuclease of OLD family
LCGYPDGFLTIDFTQQQKCSYWVMLLGDNAVGKSTLLKSIVLGLCNESDAAALIKIAESSGEFIKKGEKEGRIIIHLRENSPSKHKKYTITTTIHKVAEDAPEIVRQETQPAENFPWADIFVCGYGAYRSKQADTSYEQYKAIDAVKSLFDHQTSLQNPELIALRYLRQTPQIHSILEEKLLNILMLDPQTHAIHFTTRGLEIDGPWGRMPLQNLSDGYRSTTIWVLDFIGWLLHAERLLGNPDIGGILIIDEIEQHLHPRWQRHIVQRLRQQFPKTQIIASTHTPLKVNTTTGWINGETNRGKMCIEVFGLNRDGLLKERKKACKLAKALVIDFLYRDCGDILHQEAYQEMLEIRQGKNSFSFTQNSVITADLSIHQSKIDKMKIAGQE